MRSEFNCPSAALLWRPANESVRSWHLYVDLLTVADTLEK